MQQLQRSGYVTRVPDPDDRRAQRIELTDAGREAVAGVRDAGVRAMQPAPADWSPQELRQLATLFHRMVDDSSRTLPTRNPGPGGPRRPHLKPADTCPSARRLVLRERLPRCRPAVPRVTPPGARHGTADTGRHAVPTVE